jgi:hypothetical protein
MAELNVYKQIMKGSKERQILTLDLETFYQN